MRTEQLLAVLDDAKKLLARPDNDFSWSSWQDAEAATAEIDSLKSAIVNGRDPDVLAMQVLFTVRATDRSPSQRVGRMSEA